MLLNENVFVKGTYDSGSNCSAIDKNLLEFLGIRMYRFVDARYKMVSGYGKIVGIAKIKVKMFNISKTVFVFVLDADDFDHKFLIGLDLIKAFHLCQDEHLQVSQKLNNVKYFEHLKKDQSHRIYLGALQLSADLEHLNFSERSTISRVINDFNRAFAKDRYDVGSVKDHEASVKLTEHKYISRKPYRCNILDQQEIESQVSKLLEAGLIEESSSPFAAPVTLAYKRYSDGSRKKDRLCIDYTALNKYVVPESQPFPRVEDLIVKARDCIIFSVLDINSAFWSVPLRQKDRYKTAFVTQTGHYNWRCLPFGLKTSPAIFQRILRNVLKRNDLDGFCANYIDDILVFSKSFEEHVWHLKKLLAALEKEGFRLSLSKCNFAQPKVKYLGHIVQNNSITPIFDNVLPIKEFPQPKNQKSVRQFLGKINFYRSYIPNSSAILAPLHNLLKKNTQFKWDDRCEKVFNVIKDCLSSQPCLAIYDPTKITVVQTDASLEGIGAILKQKQEDGSFKPVAFFSKKLTEAQKRKKAIFLECLAIKEALLYWKHYLLPLKILILSDHKPLENFNVNTKVDDELRELMLQISHFNFEIKYVPGASNQEADCLSRNPVLEATQATSELKVMNLLKFEDLVFDQKDKEFRDIQKKINVINGKNVYFSKFRDTEKIIVSDEFLRKLVGKCHAKFGHIGSGQVELMLNKYFYNRNFREIISNFCQNCPVCVRSKSRIPAVFGKLSQLGPATKPFQIMSLDTVGGFAGNNSTKKYMHILVDHFSRYAFVTSSKTQKTPDFVFLLNLVLKDGHKIGTLLADQYTGINSTEFKNFCSSNNINLVFTAVDSPSSNGLNERLNQTLVNRLRCKVNESELNKKKPWSVLLTECVKEYNSTIHSVTKFTPEYLLFNVKQKLVPFLEDKITSNLDLDREIALENSRKSHERNKKIFDRKRKDFVFKVNDLVYVNHGNSLNKNKLEAIRTGPFRILRKISDSIFLVDSGYQKHESNIYHISKLYPFRNI